jgi:exodeoxyribonuclease-3
MRIATWNVNSLNARLPRVTEWMQQASPDVLCIQETKLANDAFPSLDIAALGYESVHFGQGQWNGVAIISRVGIADVSTGFGDLDDPYAGEARCISAQCGGVRVFSVYVPNGREVASDFYERKLTWLAQLRKMLDAHYSPEEPLAILGDYNVAPNDDDVWSMKAFADATHVTDRERQALTDLRDWGLTDAYRVVHPLGAGFTYYDYRRGDFHQGRGMRIDLAYVTAPLAAATTFAVVDRNARKGDQPSDHAPVIFDFDLT